MTIVYSYFAELNNCLYILGFFTIFFRQCDGNYIILCSRYSINEY